MSVCALRAHKLKVVVHTIDSWYTWARSSFTRSQNNRLCSAASYESYVFDNISNALSRSIRCHFFILCVFYLCFERTRICHHKTVHFTYLYAVSFHIRKRCVLCNNIICLKSCFFLCLTTIRSISINEHHINVSSSCLSLWMKIKLEMTHFYGR